MTARRVWPVLPGYNSGGVEEAQGPVDDDEIGSIFTALLSVGRR